MTETEPLAAVPRRKLRLSWPVLGSLLLAAVAVAIVFSGMEHLWRTSGEQRCRRDLEFFSQALMIYRTSQGGLPPVYLTDRNGRRMQSWRPFLMSVVDWNEHSASDQRYKFDQPWDSPTNTRFLNETGFYEYYSCPFYANGSHNATYVCVVGSALWPSPKTKDEYWNNRQTSGRAGGLLPSQGKAILFVELMESDIPWTKPADISLSELVSLLRDDPSGGRFRRRTRHVVAVDAAGTPFILDPLSDIEEIKKLVESEAAGKTGRGQ